MQKKILVLGVGQHNFLYYLYSALKAYNNSYTVVAPFVRELDKSVKSDNSIYNNELVSNKVSLYNYVRAFLVLPFDGFIYQTFFFILFVERKFKKAAHFVLKYSQAKAFFLQNDNFKSFDIFHFHYLQYSYVRELFLIPKGKNIVCTFWGSDLLRTADILNLYIIKRALNKATTITCQSLELKEIILSKYGRHLESKINVVMFPIDTKTYDAIDVYHNKQLSINEFKATYHYSNEKINVLIGHNGSMFNNHENIIKALGQLQQKEKVHLIVNLNYGLPESEKESYKNKLTQVLENTKISFVVLENFFSGDELAIARLASEVFIHMPISDALSGTMLEMLYASNIVITGSWLPYKTFVNAGLKYHEVSDISKLPALFDTIISHYETEKEIAKQNHNAIKVSFFGNSIIAKWNQILK
jgi:hypothetical protein